MKRLARSVHVRYDARHVTSIVHLTNAAPSRVECANGALLRCTLGRSLSDGTAARALPHPRTDERSDGEREPARTNARADKRTDARTHEEALSYVLSCVSRADAHALAGPTEFTIISRTNDPSVARARSPTRGILVQAAGVVCRVATHGSIAHILNAASAPPRNANITDAVQRRRHTTTTQRARRIRVLCVGFYFLHVLSTRNNLCNIGRWLASDLQTLEAAARMGTVCEPAKSNTDAVCAGWFFALTF